MRIEERTAAGWKPIPLDLPSDAIVEAFWRLVERRSIGRAYGHRQLSLRLVDGQRVTAAWHAGKFAPGDRFGRLEVTAVKRKLFGDRLLIVDCTCGRRGHLVRESSLRSGRSRSCGCYRDDVMRARRAA